MILSVNLSASRLGAGTFQMSKKPSLIGIQYMLEKQQQGGTGSNQFTEERDQNEPSAKNAEKIAQQQHHIGPATVKRAEKFAEAWISYIKRRKVVLTKIFREWYLTIARRKTLEIFLKFKLGRNR